MLEIIEKNKNKFDSLPPLHQDFISSYIMGDAGAIEVLCNEFGTQELEDLYIASWHHVNFEEDGEPYDDFVDRFRNLAIKYIGIDILTIEDTYGRG